MVNRILILMMFVVTGCSGGSSGGVNESARELAYTAYNLGVSHGKKLGFQECKDGLEKPSFTPVDKEMFKRKTPEGI